MKIFKAAPRPKAAPAKKAAVKLQPAKVAQARVAQVVRFNVDARPSR